MAQSRTGGVLAGAFIASYGILRMVRGEMSYSNYWGGVAFAPLTILIGALVVFVALFRPGATWRDKKGRPIRFPADDFRKW